MAVEEAFFSNLLRQSQRIHSRERRVAVKASSYLKPSKAQLSRKRDKMFLFSLRVFDGKGKVK